MNDLTLYEQIPKSSFPIRLLDFHNEPYTFPIHWHEHIIFSAARQPYVVPILS